ncbi:hypothetical protein [Microvirga vignae]|nr:hypothetical protein [Microvirga vignae]
MDDKINKLLRMGCSAPSAERENARTAFWGIIDAAKLGPHDVVLLRRDQADNQQLLTLEIIKENRALHDKIAELMRDKNRLQAILMEYGHEDRQQEFDAKQIDRTLPKVKSFVRQALLMRQRLDLWLVAHGTDRNFVRDTCRMTGLSKDTIHRAKRRGTVIDTEILKRLIGGPLDNAADLDALCGPAGNRGLSVEEQRAYVERKLEEAAGLRAA